MIPLQVHTPSNCKSPYESQEEEAAARCESVSGMVRIMRQQLPALLKRLQKIPDPRDPNKTKYKITLLMLYGSQKIAFAILWDEHLLQRKSGGTVDTDSGEEQDYQYYVYVLEASLSFSNGMVIPLMSEFLNYQQGDGDKNKQDCEQKAFHRLAARIKKAFPRLPIMLLLDGLYANGPIMQHCHDYNWDFMIVLKSGSLSTVWEEYESLLPQEKTNLLQRNWGGREQSFQWVNQIRYEYGANGKNHIDIHVVVCHEQWLEVDSKTGEFVTKKMRHAWISSRLMNQFNTLARFSSELAGLFKQCGVRGAIGFIRETLTGPWLDSQEIDRQLKKPFRLRLV